MRSFEKLYKAYSEQIYRYLLYVTANDHIAEELLQETFYQAFLSIYRFKGIKDVTGIPAESHVVLIAITPMYNDGNGGAGTGKFFYYVETE